MSRTPDTGLISTRWSRATDGRALAEVHAAAWRYAYAGIIPGAALERRISRRGPRSWEGRPVLVIECGDALAGYAVFGQCRIRPPSFRGEIFELYVRPEYQGCGFGRRLFADARRHLARWGFDDLLVWSLADNTIGCAFYRALGGRVTARGLDHSCGVPLEKIAFTWH